MIKFFRFKKIIMALAVSSVLFSVAPASAQEDKKTRLERLGSKSFPDGVKLTISHSYKQPGSASLNFSSPNVESSCASVSDYDVTIKESLNILDIEFSNWAIQTYKLLDESNRDLCGKHSYASYRLPLDLKEFSKKGITQIRIWNSNVTEAFKLEDLGEDSYRISPVTKGNKFKIGNHENVLTYTQYPAYAFRVFPDYAPYNEELMLREIRAITRDKGYELHDYTVRYDDRKRPYYIVIDNEDMAVIDGLKSEPFLPFANIDIDEKGRIIPLRINIGRL
jgi:hypothetical protein